MSGEVQADVTAIGAFFEWAREKVRGGGMDIFMLLLPMLEELFAMLMERCANTEDAAVELVCDPTPRQVDYMIDKVFRASRRDPQLRQFSRRERMAAATQAVWNSIAAANDDPEKVGAAWREVNA